MIMQKKKTRKYTKKQRKNEKQIHNLIYTENETQTCISDFHFVTLTRFSDYFTT